MIRRVVLEKVCTTCRSPKPTTEFYPQRTRGGRLMSTCKACTNAAATRGQKVLQARELVPIPATKVCTACGAEKAACDFSKNRGAICGLLARCKACYKAARAARTPKAVPSAKRCTKCGVTKPSGDFHPDRRNASGVQSHCRACVSKRRVAHNTTPRGFQQKKQSEHRRRVQKRSEPSDVTPESWAATLEEFGHRCAYCLQPGELHIDHVEPVGRGGLHQLANIVPACIRCNGSKCDRTLLECLMTPHLLVTKSMVALPAA